VTIQPASFFGAFTALLALTACADFGGDVSPTRPIDVRPVVDRAPYWCELVPQEAFRRVTGLLEPLTDQKADAWQTNGACTVKAADKSKPLSVSWSATGDSQRVLDGAHAAWDDSNPTAIPTDLGEGFAALPVNGPHSTQPYFVISSFDCGKTRPWLALEVRPIGQGRNAITDLIDLMRIAQTRYGRLFSCVPGDR
jgi:hypothetical protein